MKRILLLALVVLAINANAKVRVISDFDDTIKRSNIVNGGSRTAGRAILFYKAYRAMPELFQEMINNSEGLYVLSASPGIVGPIIKATLKSYHIPYLDIFTRDLDEIGSEEKKIAYKLESIESVLNENPEDDLILLGDNIEADHKVYLKVVQRNPSKVLSIYIRKVFNTELPSGVDGFYTAFEVAAKEFERGRLNLKQVKRVADKILDTKKHRMYRLIPYYAYCPVEPNEFSATNSADLKQMEKEIILKVSDYCKLRESLL